MPDLNAPQSQDSTTENRGDSKDSHAFTNVPLGSQNPPSPTNPNCSHYHPKPTPWWKRISTWQFVAEIALFIVGIRVACIYSGQLETMIEANKMNRDFYEAQNRPWLGLVNGDAKIIKSTPQPLDIQFDADLRNYGRSPAIYGLPKFGLYDLDTATKQALAKPVESQLCESILGQEFRHELGTVFPGDTGTTSHRFDASWGNPPATPHRRPNVVIGCIGYAQESSISTIYYTAVVYEITKYGSDDIRKPEFFAITEIKQLSVTPWDKAYACHFDKPCD